GSQERGREPQGVGRVPRAGGRGTEPANEPEAEQSRRPGEPRQRENKNSGAEAAGRDDRESGPDADRKAGEARRDDRERRERDVVDQAQREQGEADRRHGRRTAGRPAHDRDPRRLVEPAGQGDPHDRRSSARRRKGERATPLAGAA